MRRLIDRLRHALRASSSIPIRTARATANSPSNRFAREFGLRLLPDLYALYKLLSYDHARDLEVLFRVCFS